MVMTLRPHPPSSRVRPGWAYALRGVGSPRVSGNFTPCDYSCCDVEKAYLLAIAVWCCPENTAGPEVLQGFRHDLTPAGLKVVACWDEKENGAEVLVDTRRRHSPERLLSADHAGLLEMILNSEKVIVNSDWEKY